MSAYGPAPISAGPLAATMPSIRSYRNFEAIGALLLIIELLGHRDTSTVAVYAERPPWVSVWHEVIDEGWTQVTIVGRHLKYLRSQGSTWGDNRVF